MLQFCHAIKYGNIWHVNEMYHQGAESTSCSLEHVLFLRVESLPGQSVQRYVACQVAGTNDDVKANHVVLLLGRLPPIATDSSLRSLLFTKL